MKKRKQPRRWRRWMLLWRQNGHPGLSAYFDERDAYSNARAMLEDVIEVEIREVVKRRKR